TTRNRLLPGAASYNEIVDQFRIFGREHQIPEDILNRAINKFGSRVKLIGENRLKILGGEILQGEVEIALDLEQAETLEDLMRRRLDLEFMPGHGFEALPEIL